MSLSPKRIENPDQRRAAVFRDELHEIRRTRWANALVIRGIERRREGTLPFAHRAAGGVPDNAFARALGDEQSVLREGGDGCGTREPGIRDRANDMKIAVERNEPAVWRVGSPRQVANARRRRAAEKEKRVPFIDRMRTGADVRHEQDC